MELKRLENLGGGSFKVQDERGDVFNYNENSNNRGEVEYNIYDQGETPVNAGNMPSTTREGNMLDIASSSAAKFGDLSARLEAGTEDALSSFYKNNPLTSAAMQGGAMVSDAVPTDGITNSGVIPFLNNIIQDDKVKRNPAINAMASGLLNNAHRIRGAFEGAMFNLGAETDEAGNTFLNPDISPISNRNIGKKVINVSKFVSSKFGDLLENAMRSVSTARDMIKSSSENINQYESPDSNLSPIDYERILNLTTGGAATGSIGGAFRNLPSNKLVANIMKKNKLAIDAIKKSKGTGDASMSSRDRAFLREEKSKYLK